MNDICLTMHIINSPHSNSVNKCTLFVVTYGN